MAVERSEAELSIAVESVNELADERAAEVFVETSFAAVWTVVLALAVASSEAVRIAESICVLRLEANAAVVATATELAWDITATDNVATCVLMKPLTTIPDSMSWRRESKSVTV